MIRFTGTTPPLAGRCQEIFFDPAAPSNTVTGVVESSVGDRTTKDNTNVVYNGRSVTTTGLAQMSGFVVGAGKSSGTSIQFGSDCSPLFATSPNAADQDLCISFSVMLKTSTKNSTSFSFGNLNGAPYYTVTLSKGSTPVTDNQIRVTAVDNYLNANLTTRTTVNSDWYYYLASPYRKDTDNSSMSLNKWFNITVSIKRVLTSTTTPFGLTYTVRVFVNGFEHAPYNNPNLANSTPAMTPSILKTNTVNPWTNTLTESYIKILSSVTSYSKINYRNNFFDFGGLGDVLLHDFRIYENNSDLFGVGPSDFSSFGSKNNYANGLRNPILSQESRNNLILRYLLETGPQNIPNSSVTGLIDTTKNVGLVGILPVFIKGSNNIYNYGLYPGPPISYYSGFKDSKPLIKSIFSFGTQLNTSIHDGATSSNIRLVTTEKTINSSSTGNDTILFDIQLDDGLDPQDYLVKDLFVVPTAASPLDLFLGRYPRVELYGQRNGDPDWIRLLTYNQGDGGTFPNTPPQGQSATTCNITYANYAGTPGIRRGAPGSGVTREGLTFSILNTSAPSGITYDTTSPIRPANLAAYITSGNYFRKYQFRIVPGIGSSLFTCSVSGGIASSTATSNGITIDRINNNYYIEHIFCNVIKQNIPVVNNYSLGFNANFDTGQFRNTFNFREKFNVFTTKHFDLFSPTPFSMINNIGHDTVSSGDNFYIPSYQRYTFDLPLGVIESTGTTISPGANTPTFGTTGYQSAVATQRLPTAETLPSSVVDSRELLNGQSSAVVLPFLNQNWKGQPSSTNSIANTNNTITLRKRGKIRATASMVQGNCIVNNSGNKLAIYDVNSQPIDITGYTITNGDGTNLSILNANLGQILVTSGLKIYNLLLTKTGSETYHFPAAEGFNQILYCSNSSLNVYAQLDDNNHQWTTQDDYHYNFYNGFTFYTRSGNTLRVPIGTSGSLINATQTNTWTEGVTNLGANRTNSWNNCESKIKFTSPEVLNILSLTAAANGTPITNNVSNSTPASLVLTKTQIATLCNTTTSGFKRMMFCIERGPYLSHLTFYRSDIAEEGTAAVTQLDTYFK